MRMILIACAALFLVVPTASANDLDEIRASFEGAIAALNAGNLDGFLDTVHDDALSFYSCGPTSGACAVGCWWCGVSPCKKGAYATFAHSRGHKRYLACNLLHHNVLTSQHQH